MASTKFKNDMVITGDLTVDGAITANGVAVPAGTQAANITDFVGTGTYATDEPTIETKINSIIAALEAFGITASS